MNNLSEVLTFSKKWLGYSTYSTLTTKEVEIVINKGYKVYSNKIKKNIYTYYTFLNSHFTFQRLILFSTYFFSERQKLKLPYFQGRNSLKFKGYKGCRTYSTPYLSKGVVSVVRCLV